MTDLGFRRASELYDAEEQVYTLQWVYFRERAARHRPARDRGGEV